VPATRIFTIADIFSNPHYHARGMLVPTPDEDMGTVTLAGPVPKLSDTPGILRHAGRGIGHDTGAVLREALQLQESEIQALFAAGIVR
jgi:crotonobetainyl-CoA:carnitine CoA-transferase CaiB-like acyl-CoA transferase